jgi:hypothetical protein
VRPLESAENRSVGGSIPPLGTKTSREIKHLGRGCQQAAERL